MTSDYTTDWCEVMEEKKTHMKRKKLRLISSTSEQTILII
jgi:hypothetical protein